MTDKKNQIPGISYQFNDASLMRAALTHRSRGRSNNERMEFLGDSILNFVIASRVYQLRPDDSEGDLSRLRSRVVRGETLARLAVNLKLGDCLIMGEGELKSGGFRRKSILADALEAVLGAIYLDGGYQACADIIDEIFGEVIKSLPAAESLKDPKTRLQESMQARARPLPEYQLIREEGAEHAKQFSVRVSLPDCGMQAESTGSSLRKAEQAAAKKILLELNESRQ